jgi:hypothetical protein
MAAWREPIRDDDFDDDEVDDSCDDTGEDDWRLRPQWLHYQCVNPCMALDLGTCCKYPAEPLVRRAVDVADAVDAAVRRAGQGGCAPAAAEVARIMLSVPGLLAQVHAAAPGASQASAAQLLCPVGRLAGALDQACEYGCPWACGDPEIPDRRAEFAPVAALLEDCATALRAALGWPH